MVLVVPLLGLFIRAAVRFGRSSGLRLAEIEFGVLFVIITAVLVQITGFLSSPLLPVTYFTASILALTIRPGIGFLLFALLVAADLLPRFLVADYASPVSESIERGLMLLFFFGFFLFYGRVESLRRHEAAKRLRRFEEDLKGVFSGIFERDKSISEKGVGKEAARTLADIDDLLFEILDRAKAALAANTVAFLVPSGSSDLLRIREGVSTDEAFDFEARMDLEIYRKALGQKMPLLLTSGQGSHRIDPGYYRKTSQGVCVISIVPVVDGDESLGLLVCDSRRENGITKKDVAFLELVAVMVRDMQNIIVHLRRLSLGLTEFEELYGVSRELAGARRTKDVCTIVYGFCQRMLPVRTMAFTVTRGADSEIISSCGQDAEKFERRRFSNDDSLVGWVCRNNKYLVFSQKERRRDIFGEAIPVDGEGSLAVFPLVYEEGVTGTFTIHTHSKTPPSSFHIRLIEVVLNLAAVSITGIRSMAKLKRLAVTDPLTGLYNRRSFNKALRRTWEHADRYTEPLSLLMIDIDKFKAINDTYGHPAGDEVIKAVAQTILSATRKVDVVSRIGGEEFAVLLPNSSNKSSFVTAERIRKAMKKNPVPSGKKKISVTVSVGIATFPDNARLPDSLMKVADKALYAAKEGGRDRSMSVP